MTLWRPATAAALVLVLASACGGYDPDMAAIETDLAQQFADREDVPDATVDCPSTVDWDPGSDFHCTADAMMLIGDRRLTVSMENDQGEYTWIVEGE